jgi:hypothetical protein
MSRIEELPDDFEEKLDINGAETAASDPSKSVDVDVIEQMLSQATPFPPKPGYVSVSHGIGPAMPPAMENIRQYTADEVVTMLNRTPLFMTTLDETDGKGGVNEELEAFRALAYEGTRAEVAGNFREQGNEQARAKKWINAKGFYDQALATLRAPQTEQPEDTPELDIVQLNDEDEAKKELLVQEACYVNRALCNLELSKQFFRCEHIMRTNADGSGRKLSGLQPRLRRNFETQPIKRQSMVPLRVGVLGFGQNSRSRRRLRARARSRKPKQGSSHPQDRNSKTKGLHQRS